MNYDTMSIDDLEACSVEELIRYVEVKTRHWVPARFVSAIRKAVIREASVGHISCNPAGIDGVPLLDALCFTKTPGKGWNDYDLVPKETP